MFCSNEIAYSSSDKMVYIRRFSPKGIEMVLLSTLQGHYNEVTCVKWNAVMGKWVTGSEDGTIRIWVSMYSHTHTHTHPTTITYMHTHPRIHSLSIHTHTHTHTHMYKQKHACTHNYKR